VLDHFNHELNNRMGGIEDCDGNKLPVQIMLLGGADLVETFSQPGVWSLPDLNHMYVALSLRCHRLTRRFLQPLRL
jgi:nicotinamide mononucleotide adenylyltransferase